MQPLDSLIQEASLLGEGPDRSEIESEAARQLEICNACRYCEGYCAMFPAMTERLMFEEADIHYLANLCHNCGACLHACQYAPPHEFGVNIPQIMAKVRGETYKKYAWPLKLGVLYEANGIAVGLAFTIAIAAFLMLAAAMTGSLWSSTSIGNFYHVFPHNFLISVFTPVFIYALVVLGLGTRNFVRDIKPATTGNDVSFRAMLASMKSALSLQYLGGGHGEGCTNEDDDFTLARRRFHHFTFYGFILCFAATSLGTIYHYAFSWYAPYNLPAIPKILGAIGGVALIIGTVGLLVLNLRRHPLHGDGKQKPMDVGFICLLFVISLSGLLVWTLRDTVAMASLLCIHLGSVMALFLTMPYGKFAHGFYRVAALVRYAVELATGSETQREIR